MAKKQLSDLDFNGTSRILGLPTPISTSEPVRLLDLNSALSGLAWKDSARVASQVNITLSSPGSAIDGITLVSGDRVLIQSQTIGSENGIYIWSGSTTPMTRAADSNTALALEQATVSVEEGSSANKTYRQNIVNFVLDTDSIVWSQFGTSAGAASETSQGIAELATQSETDTGTDDLRIVTPLKLNTWTGKTKRAQGLVGDGSATQFDIAHNFNTRDITVSIYENSGTFSDVGCDISRPSVNLVRLTFAVAPSSNAYRVTVLA